LREGSPLSARLLERAADDLDAGGPVYAVPSERGREWERAGTALALRFMGVPLRLLEVGAGADLNLLWDQFRYEGAGVA
jgi:hypothetical protein